jgi:hypothetical protein
MANNENRYITDDLSDISSKELIDALPNYFDSSENIQTTAYLNWRFDFNRDLENKFFDMAKGYLESSIALTEQCLANNRDKKADTWIFPILFNVVHGIEVYLKGFNSLYRIHMDLQNYDDPRDSKIEGKHDIRQLCQIAVKLLRDTRNDELLDEVLFVQRFIDILYQNTEDMTFARYPITTKKENQFYIEAEGNVTIDLHVLRQWVLRIAHILDNVTGYIDYQVDQMQEWRSEMLSYIDGY